jgi:multidrug efflux pump
VRLSDVANVTDSVQTVRSLGLMNGKPAALLIIFRQPGANIIDTVDAIKARCRSCTRPSARRST